MRQTVLVLGATGLLGRSVTRAFLDKGFRVRLLTRNLAKPWQMFRNTVDMFQGSALDRDSLRMAMPGCNAVHISLSQESELAATRHVVELATGSLERISYVSATTAREENRWFDVIDVKMRTEEILRQSGIAHTVFCPTWAMETLSNFIKEDRAVVIIGKNPPPLHFFAAVDFGRIVADSYRDDRALGKRLFVHGPEAITLPQALERYIFTCHPELRTMRLKLWQGKLIAKLIRPELRYVTQLISYLDRVGELGDPGETNALFGAPQTTLDEWLQMPERKRPQPAADPCADEPAWNRSKTG